MQCSFSHCAFPVNLFAFPLATRSDCQGASTQLRALLDDWTSSLRTVCVMPRDSLATRKHSNESSLYDSQWTVTHKPEHRCGLLSPIYDSSKVQPAAVNLTDFAQSVSLADSSATYASVSLKVIFLISDTEL